MRIVTQPVAEFGALRDWKAVPALRVDGPMTPKVKANASLQANRTSSTIEDHVNRVLAAA